MKTFVVCKGRRSTSKSVTFFADHRSRWCGEVYTHFAKYPHHIVLTFSLRGNIEKGQVRRKGNGNVRPRWNATRRRHHKWWKEVRRPQVGAVARAGWCWLGEWSCKTVLDRPRWWRRVCNCSCKGGFSLGNWCQQWIPVSVSRQEKLWDRDVGFLTQSGHHRDEQYFLADLCGCQCHRDTLRLWWIALRIFEPKEQHQWRVSTEKICTADFAG